MIFWEGRRAGLASKVRVLDPVRNVTAGRNRPRRRLAGKRFFHFFGQSRGRAKIIKVRSPGVPEGRDSMKSVLGTRPVYTRLRSRKRHLQPGRFARPASGIIDRRLGGESNREIVFVSFVRACERSCVWPRDDVVSEAGLRKLAACCGVSACRVPARALPFAVAKPLPCFTWVC